MKRNSSFASNILSNFDGSPQVQKIELKKQKKNFSISQAINDYNLKKSRQRLSSYNINNTINNMNTSNYNTHISNVSKQNANTTRKKPSITSMPLPN